MVFLGIVGLSCSVATQYNGGGLKPPLGGLAPPSVKSTSGGFIVVAINRQVVGCKLAMAAICETAHYYCAV